MGGASLGASPSSSPPPPASPGATPYSPYPPAGSPGAPSPSSFSAATASAAYPPAYGVPGGGSPAFGAEDGLALSNVNLAAIIGLVGTVLSIVELFFTRVSSLINVTTAGSGTSLSLDLSALYFLVAVGGLGLILTLLELWFYRQAFRTLARQDGRFSTPSSLVLAAIVALVIVVVTAFALVGVVYQAILCAGSGNPITSRCLNVGALVGLAAVLGIAAIVLLIGGIGLLIGIWRLGTRYGEGMFKVGAIFLIIPLLNIVGLVLILLAVRSARARTLSVSSPLRFG